MVDRAAIFTDLTRRNALRREAELPLLDIQTEFNHAVEVALWNEGLEVYADDIARAIDETWADLRQRYGADFPQSVGGRWLVHFEGTKRVHALLADRGVYRPVPRHSVKYGEDNNHAAEVALRCEKRGVGHAEKCAILSRIADLLKLRTSLA